jgi:predicted nucleic-acid-binding Zn-ribbon protein
VEIIRLHNGFGNSSTILTGANANDIVHSEYSIYSPIHYKKCGEYRYLTPHAFWNVDDLGIKCPKCETINTVTIVMGELKKLV